MDHRVQTPSPAPKGESPGKSFESYLLEFVRACTAEGYVKIVRRLGNLADLENIDAIKHMICTAKVSEGRKVLMTNAYDHYVRYRGHRWSKPRFIRQDKPIMLPLESELDALISNTGLKMSTFLQFLKETGVDSGEAWNLRWIDIDTERNMVSITPTKNHNTRILPVSANLVSRLLRLKRINDRVFSNIDLDDFRGGYTRVRRNLATKLGNARINNIAFKSFRHYKGTMLYHQTKDILYCKWFLGHKRIENTLVYTHMVNFANDEYICKVAGSLEEAKQLIEDSFEYVTEMSGVKLFRKRK